MQILEAFWRLGPSSVREILETFTKKRKPAYTTIQTVVYRLERKKALRCVKRISNANIFEAAITPEEARRAFVDEMLSMFGGRVQALMSHLIESGNLTMKDIKEAESVLRKAEKKEAR
jgi:predicted transcriptional regulator